MSVRDLIDAIAFGDSQTTQSAFETEMMSRVSNRMDQMRADVAQSMFKSEQAETVVEEEVALDEATTDEKVEKHNAAVKKMTRRSFAKLDYNHPDLLKRAPKGYSFTMDHQVVRRG